MENEQDSALPPVLDVDMEMVISEWGTAKTNRESYTNDFRNLDSIADGIPITKQEDTPYVGDTTIAGLVRSIPRNAIKQVPIFAANINGTKNSVHALICSFLLRDRIFNQDTFGKGLLSTLQMGCEQALTHGYAPFMTATGVMYDDFGTNLRLLHYADVDPEPGISDHNEAGFDYAVANLPKSRVKKILKKAENNPNTTWNVPALKRLLEMIPEAAQNYSIYETDAKNKSKGNNPTYSFATRYETGKEAEFITFCPQIKDEALRVVTSRSKFGFPRINFLVIDPAPLSPFGVSRVRLASPNQNLMNAYYQNVASMFILNSRPPLLIRGRFVSPVQLRQGAQWKTLDPQAGVELKELSNSSLTQFVQIAQQMSAQIQNIMGMPQGTVNSNGTNLGFSKTAPGVKAQQDFTDVSTNQITNLLENFLRQHGIVALDTIISEQTEDAEEAEEDGETIETQDEPIIVDDECKNAINRLYEEQFTPTPEQPVPVPPIGDDNVFLINWNDFYDHIKKISVEIELSIGKDELEEKTRGDLQDTLTVLAQNAEMLGPDAVQRVRQLTDMLLEKTVPESKRLNLSTPPAPVNQPPVDNVGTSQPVSDQVTMSQ